MKSLQALVLQRCILNSSFCGTGPRIPVIIYFIATKEIGK